MRLMCCWLCWGGGGVMFYQWGLQIWENHRTWFWPTPSECQRTLGFSSHPNVGGFCYTKTYNLPIWYYTFLSEYWFWNFTEYICYMFRSCLSLKRLIILWLYGRKCFQFGRAYLHFFLWKSIYFAQTKKGVHKNNPSQPPLICNVLLVFFCKCQ